jgi:hypothetical protein
VVAFTLEWSREEGKGPSLEQADFPSLFRAVREKLGLRLETRRVPVDLLIIDIVARLSRIDGWLRWRDPTGIENDPHAFAEDGTIDAIDALQNQLPAVREPVDRGATQYVKRRPIAEPRDDIRCAGNFGTLEHKGLTAPASVVSRKFATNCGHTEGFGHGFTRIHTDENKESKCAYPCESV